MPENRDTWAVPRDAFDSAPSEKWPVLEPVHGVLFDACFAGPPNTSKWVTFFLPDGLPEGDCCMDPKYLISNWELAGSKADAEALLRKQAINVLAVKKAETDALQEFLAQDGDGPGARKIQQCRALNAAMAALRFDPGLHDIEAQSYELILAEIRDAL